MAGERAARCTPGTVVPRLPRPGPLSRQARHIFPHATARKMSPAEGKAGDYNSQDARQKEREREGRCGEERLPPASRPFRAALPAGSCSLAAGSCCPVAAGGDSVSQRAARGGRRRGGEAGKAGGRCEEALGLCCVGVRGALFPHSPRPSPLFALCARRWRWAGGRGAPGGPVS